MRFAELMPILPLIILAISSILMVLIAAFSRSRALMAFVAAGALILTIFSVSIIAPLAPARVAALFLVDSYALFFLVLIVASSLFVVILASLYSTAHPCGDAELFPLILISTLGAGVIVLSTHFISFFLGLETLSVSAYVLIAYFRTSAGFEGGLKYLVMASVASAFLLFGIALIYSQTGTLELGPLSGLSPASGKHSELYLLAGIAMVTAGIGFKIAVVPFHMWAPDIYQGSSAPVGAFIATVSKGAVFAFALRYLAVATRHEYGTLTLAISVIAILSMFAGNLLALLQTNLKRLLGYSSISHAGYVLVAFQASGAMALQAVGYYLVAYFASILGAFGVISIMAKKGVESESLVEFEGLAWRHPLIGFIFTVMLFSLAGIPLTAGFIGEFYVLSAGVASKLWLLVISLVVSTVIGLFYYLRVIVALYRNSAKSRKAEPVYSRAGTLVLTLLTLLVLFLGVYPSPLISVLSSMVTVP